jgi:hypothetical protein
MLNIKLFKKVYLVVILTTSVLSSFSQATLPSVAQLSPTASSLSLYSEIPVNYHSGLPVIDVPVYSFNSHDNKVDILLSYHAGGIRVDDEASMVGLGWAFKAGGVITKQKGLVLPGNSIPCNPIHNSSDVYNYNFNSYGGKFYIDNQTGKAIIVNQEDIDIQKLPADNGFKIITPDGYVYLFSEKEVSFTNASCSWFLKSITSHNGNIVNFEYESASEVDFKSLPDNAGEEITSLHSTVQSIQVNGGVLGPDDKFLGCPYIYGMDGSEVNPSGGADPVVIKTSYLKKISSDIGYIDLMYENRDDLNHPGALLPKRLKEIKVFSSLNAETKNLKNFTFQYDYSDYNNINNVESKRLRLTGVKEITLGGMEEQLCKVTYNNIPLPLKTSKNKDHWGFYNGPVNNSTIFPALGANREPNPSYTTAGMINSITYKTAGTSNFEFESNDYSNKGEAFKKGGGVRIKKIITTDGIKAIGKRFEYQNVSGQNTVSSGKLIYNVNYSVARGIIGIERACQGIRKQYNLQCNCTIDIPVTAYIAYSITYISNYEQPMQPAAMGYGPPVSYDKVTVYDEGIVNNGKAVYEFINDEAPTPPSPYYMGYYLPKARLDNGYLLKKTEYRYDLSNNAYLPMIMQENEYEKVNTKNIEFYVQENIVSGKPYNPNQIDCNKSNYYVRTFPSNWIRLKKKTVTNYPINNNDLPLTNIQLFTYKYTLNPKNFLVSKIENISSKSLPIIEEFKYPEDFSQNNPIYQNLVSRGIYTPVVEHTKAINGLITEQIKNYYQNSWFQDLHVIGLEKTEKKIGSGPISEIFNGKGYDLTGNILTFSGKDGIKISNIWDYNNNNLIASVTNTSNSDIAATSFETNGQGNFTFIENSTIDLEAPTGKKVYIMNPGNIVKAGLDVAKTYIVSYWSKDGQRTVNTSNAVQIFAKNGWTLYKHEVINPVNGVITISGVGTIDELRLYPKASQMTTYTYKPLIGISSKCDENDVIYYYNYDDVGRLSHISDVDKKVIKKFCYNYKGQSEECSAGVINYYNQKISKDLGKNDCPLGYDGTKVTYTVPADKYNSKISQADADAKAQNEINVNGQAYANTNGSCFDKCAMINCKGIDKKCINGNCEMGEIIVTDSWLTKGIWYCKYHYKWSDGTISQDYESSDPIICNF